MGKQMLSFGLIAALSFVGFYILRKMKVVRNMVANHFTAVLVISMVVLFSLQTALLACVSVPIGWDCGKIVGAAFGQDLSSHSTYFQTYPNNLFLLFVFRVFSKILSVFQIGDPWFPLELINALAVDAAILFSVLNMKKIFGNKSAAITFYFSILLLDFSPWLIVHYSDTFSMPLLYYPFSSTFDSTGRVQLLKKLY